MGRNFQNLSFPEVTDRIPQRTRHVRTLKMFQRPKDNRNSRPSVPPQIESEPAKLGSSSVVLFFRANNVALFNKVYLCWISHGTVPFSSAPQGRTRTFLLLAFYQGGPSTSSTKGTRVLVSCPKLGSVRTFSIFVVRRPLLM